MSTTSLARDIHGELDQRPELLELVRRVRDPDVPQSERDACLVEIVLAYRGDHSWSALLLELFASTMTAWLLEIETAEPGIDGEDLRQQLLLEVLDAAATTPIGTGRQIGKRIFDTASRRVERWLFDEEELIDTSVEYIEDPAGDEEDGSE